MFGLETIIEINYRAQKLENANIDKPHHHALTNSLCVQEIIGGVNKDFCLSCGRIGPGASPICVRCEDIPDTGDHLCFEYDTHYGA